jgi:biotin carboxylase
MKKDIVLFVNAVRPATFAALRRFKQETHRELTPLVIVDEKIQASITERNGQKQNASEVAVISADFDSASSVMAALQPHMNRILAVTSQYENSILELKKLVPYLPYVPMPTELSLDWSTEKKLMRQMMEAYDPSLVPRYMEVTNNSDITLDKIEAHIQYPMIIKPSGLEGSLLVSWAKNRDELKKIIARTSRGMQKAYDIWIKRQKPTMLVESFMEGDMYSVDTYVAADGTCRFTPPVKVVTGRKIGFDDFFGYMRITPTDLSKHDIAGAYEASEKACHAVGLRSVTAHVELMKTPEGWKIIELGPRIGGWRHEMYSLSYDMNHIVNDILNRAGEEPVIPVEPIAHVAMFNIYAEQEGVLTGIEGLEAVRKLPSFISLKQAIQPGEAVLFAKNNGDPVLEVTLSHKSRKQLETDIATMEHTLVLAVNTDVPVTEPAETPATAVAQ